MSMFYSILIKALCVIIVVVDLGQTRILDDTTNSSSLGRLEKKYHLQYFSKVNYFGAIQYCRYQGWQLASINSKEEDDKLGNEIRKSGVSNEYFWISGTDLAEQGVYRWMSTGKPLTYTNWASGEPNNEKSTTENENCIEVIGATLKWNDVRCSLRKYFICESYQNNKACF